MSRALFFYDAKTPVKRALCRVTTSEQFTDIVAEQALLASLMQSPALYWDLLDLLTPEVFTKEADIWQALALALRPASLLHARTGSQLLTLMPLPIASWTSTSAVCWRQRKSA